VFADRRETQLEAEEARALAALLWEQARTGRRAASATAAIQAALPFGSRVELDERESIRVAEALDLLIPTRTVRPRDQ
jgi:hypothetical protein